MFLRRLKYVCGESVEMSFRSGDVVAEYKCDD